MTAALIALIVLGGFYIAVGVIQIRKEARLEAQTARALMDAANTVAIRLDEFRLCFDQLGTTVEKAAYEFGQLEKAMRSDRGDTR